MLNKQRWASKTMYYVSICIKFPEKSNLQSQNPGSLLPGTGKTENEAVATNTFSWGKMTKMFSNGPTDSYVTGYVTESLN